MSSVKLNKQLILLNFRRKIFRFVNIKAVEDVYNDMREDTRKGKLGNRGRESTTSFSGPDSFKNAMRHAHNLERDFNRKNYVSQSRIEEALESMYSQLDRSRKTKVAGSKGENVAFGNTYINKLTEEKIKKWAVGEANGINWKNVR